MGLVIGAALAVGLILVVMTHSQQQNQTSDDARGVLFVGVNWDQNTAVPTELISSDVHREALGFARNGGGMMYVAVGAGEKPVEIADVSLRVERDGEIEHDAQQLSRTISARVDGALSKILATSITGQGRDVLALMAAAAAHHPAAGVPFHVILVSLGLGDQDPADSRVLMSGTPDQAVDSLPESAVPDLTGAEVSWVIPAAVGAQPSFSPKTTEWRKEFLLALTTATGAATRTFSDRNAAAPAPEGAPSAALIPNLEDVTQRPPISQTPVPPSPSTAPQPPPPSTSLASPPPVDPEPRATVGSALFIGDSAEFVSEPDARAALQPIIDTWELGGFNVVRCVGRTAAIGPAETARTLSADRAGHVGSILASEGVHVETSGIGFDDPLPPSPQDPINRSVICTAEPQ